MTPDLINALFELLGATIIALNINKVMEDKLVRGIHWYVVAFFCFWGIWNLFYYPHLDQWLSFAAGVLMVTMNMIYTALLIHYTWKENNKTIMEIGLLEYQPSVPNIIRNVPFGGKEDNDVGC